MNKFWETKSLNEMTNTEWESLCDGCARCCMIKLEDEDQPGDVHYTAVVCNLLDLDVCRCTRYPERHDLVPDCVVLTPERAASFAWLPQTCAYRRIAEGKALEEWHPLVSGRMESVHEAGISVKGRVVSEDAIHEEDLEEMIVTWVEQ